MLDSLFFPKSVAVIGASSKELSIGNRIIKNLIDFGFKGDIYPINPKADKIRDIKAFKSILDIEGTVDLAHLVIPAKFTPQAVEECGKKGVKSIIINSGGFEEIGPVGEQIQKDIVAKAKDYNIRIFGPNCLGIINTDPTIKAYCCFAFTKPDPGFISIVALSGGVTELILNGFKERGIGIRICASNGNACDVSIPEIINYLADDAGTRVIVIYLEGLKDPDNFFKAVKYACSQKPVLIMKAGRTEQGLKAAESHTGSLSPLDIDEDTVFKELGSISFTDEAELIEAAAALSIMSQPKGNRVGVITNTGGPAIIATDFLAEAGAKIPRLSKENEEFLKEKLYPQASAKNPVDVLATGTAEHYRAALDVMIKANDIDAIYVNFVTPFFVDTESIAKEIAGAVKQNKKPIICNLITDKSRWSKTVSILEDGGVPFFSLPTTAAKAMAALIKVGKN